MLKKKKYKTEYSTEYEHSMQCYLCVLCFNLIN